MGGEQAVDIIEARDAAATAPEREERPIGEMPIEEKATEIKALRDSSRALVEQLNRYPLPPLSLQAQRMETVIEALMPWADGTNEARVDMELDWERKANRLLADLLENVEAQLARAKLMGGVDMPMPPPPGDGAGIVLPGR